MKEVATILQHRFLGEIDVCIIGGQFCLQKGAVGVLLFSVVCYCAPHH